MVSSNEPWDGSDRPSGIPHEDPPVRAAAEARSLLSHGRIFARSPVGLCVLEDAPRDHTAHCDYVVVDVNPSWERITGINRADALNHRIRDIFPPMVAIWMSRYDHFSLSWDEDFFEEYVPTLGKHLTLHTFGIAPGIYGVFFTDVTDRYRMIERHNVDDANFRTMLNSTNDLIALYDEQMRLVNFNSAFERTMHELTGVPIVPGMRVIEHVDDSIRVQWQQLIDDALTGVSVHDSWRYLSRTGPRVFDLSLYPVQVITGVKGYVAYSRDITPLKQVQEDLLEARDTALRSARLKETFISTLSHEIRTPLNIILGSLGLIEDQVDDAVRHEYGDILSNTHESADRLMRTIDLTLSLSRINSGNYTPTRDVFHPDILLEHLVGEHAVLARGKHLDISFTCDIPGIMVETDRHCMETILENLLGNAVKFTDAGGITIRIHDEDTRIILSIADTGIGISDEYLPHLFEAYSQEVNGYTRPYEGIGLGLAVTRRYLDLLHIPVDVRSTKDVGTTFNLDITSITIPPA